MNHPECQRTPGARLSVTTRRAAAFVLGCALLLPVSVPLSAAGLGQAEVHSYLNQPLDMRIPLLGSAGDQPPDQLQLELASDAHYREAGLTPPARDAIRIRVELAEDGTAWAHVTSAEPIREPFLRLLVELSGTDSRLVRDYTVLLDPPPATYADAPPTADEPTAETPTTSAEPAIEAAADDAYGPVSSGLSLWQVAESVQPAGATLYQTIVAIHDANPDAFVGGDIERLRVGVMLDIPDRDTITARSQTAAATAYRARIGDDEPPATVVAEVIEEPASAPESADLPADDFRILSQIWAIETMPVADNGGATADIAPVESRLDQIQDRLGALERSVASGHEQTGETLATQADVLERVEQRLQGIEGRLDAVNEDAAASRGSGTDIPMLTAGLAAFAAFLLGLIGGLITGRRRHATDGDTAPAAPQKTVATAPVATATNPQPQESDPSPSDSSPFADQESPTRPAPSAGAPGFEVTESEPSVSPLTDEPNTERPESRFGGGAAVDPDDPVNVADMYLAEDLPSEAADSMWSAIEARGLESAPTHWWVKHLECLRGAGNASAFIESARICQPHIEDSEVWNDIVRMGLEIAPDERLFTAAGDEPAHVPDDAHVPDAEPVAEVAEPDEALEFTLDDIPDLSDSRPVHGGAPEGDASSEDSVAGEEAASEWEEIEVHGLEDTPQDLEEEVESTGPSTPETEEFLELDDSFLEEFSDFDDDQPASLSEEEFEGEIGELDESLLEEEEDADADDATDDEPPAQRRHTQ